MTCHNCRIDAQRHGRDRKGNQRYKCQQCSKTFLEPRSKPLGGMYLPIEKAEMILRMLLEGNSVSRYLLNKPGRSGRFPRRTEIHRLGSLFDQVRQGGHLLGTAYPVANVLKEVHAQFPGCAQQRFHRIPSPGAGQ